MKNDWRFSSLAIVLLLHRVLHLDYGCAIHVYQNNEYEVSDIDKRLDIPHPGGRELHHHGHHKHRGLKRHHVTTVVDTPLQTSDGQLLFRRQEVPLPVEEWSTTHHHHNHHQHHHRHSRGFKNPPKHHAHDTRDSEFTFALPDDGPNEVLYKKSEIPTSSMAKKSNMVSEDTDHGSAIPEKEVARHEIGFLDDFASLKDLVHKAEKDIERSRSTIASQGHPGQKRQEIIHALNDDKAKTEPDDDIESLGRRMDETGNEIKDAKYEQTPIGDKHAAAATRYIISKIQEIQDKLFKRTGNKELEDKLNLMAQGDKAKKKDTGAITLIQNTTAATMTNSSSPITNNTVSKDKTQTAERRKIIPEEVVDKILEKFQQLKKEAKHMAVSKSRHSVEHATPLPAAQVIEKKTEEENPYAQIGKPTKETKKDNVTDAAADNRDKLPESISRLLSAKDTKIGTIQIPIGSFANGGGGGVSGGKPGPIPIMFIKSQGRLVPVFDSPEASPLKQPSVGSATAQPETPPQPSVESPKMTVTADTRAQLDGTAGVAEANPNLMTSTPLQQPKSSDQAEVPHLNNNMRFTMADHLLDKLNGDAGLAQPSSASMPSGYLKNFQSVAEDKESESSRARQLSMAESLLDRLNVNSGVAQPNLLPGGAPPQANFAPSGFDQPSFRAPSMAQERDEAGRSRELSMADQLLNKLNVNSGVAQPNAMPSNLMNMFSTLMQPGRQEMQKYKNNFGIDNQFTEMSSERMGEGRSGSHKRIDEDACTRGSISGYDCEHFQTKLRHKSEDKYDNPDIPSTEDIIQNVLHSPDFPTVAAHILHNSVVKDDRKELPVLGKYSDEEMKEHYSRGERERSREREREEEREEEREKEKEEEEEEDKEDREYGRLHRHKGKARHTLAESAQASGRESPEELLKHMMEQLPSSPRGMDQLAPSPLSSPAEQMNPNAGITSFFNGGAGPINPADINLSPSPSPQDIANQAEALRDRLNVMSQDPAARNNMQGLNPGQIQFNMQHNLAPGPVGEPSMIDPGQALPLGGGPLPPDPPSLRMPLDSYAGGASSPVSDDLQRQMGITGMETLQVNPRGLSAQNPVLDMLSTKGTSRHHISGAGLDSSPFPGTMPPPLGANEGFIGGPAKMDFPEQEQLSAETPDQLLEYAKQKAFRQQLQSTKFDRLGHDTKESEGEMLDSDTDAHLPILPHIDSHQLSRDPTQLLDLIHSPFNSLPDGEVGQSRSNVHPELSSANPTDMSNLPLGNVPFDLPVKAEVPMKSMSSDASHYEHSPDVLLEQLRKQRDKEMGIDSIVDPVTFNKYKKARYMEDYAKARGEIPSAVDPSLADFINNGPEESSRASSRQRMEIQSHSIASSDKRNSRYAGKSRSLSNQIDILPGDIVQYNHGKMSSDPANVINSFFKDNNFNYRNSIPRYRNAIARPDNASTNADGSINRASIIRTLPHSHVELRINGKKLTPNRNQRRNKLGGPSNNPNGETIFSKGPVKLELSHADDRSKIVNIITSAPYNVTDDRKRTNIAKVHKVH